VESDAQIALKPGAHETMLRGQGQAANERGGSAERWETSVLVQHKPSTQDTMRSHINKYLVPAFGDFPLRDVQPENVQRFIASLRTSPQDCPKYLCDSPADVEVRQGLAVRLSQCARWGCSSKAEEGSKVLPHANRDATNSGSGSRTIPNVLLGSSRNRYARW
jgi:hypothetical protein